MSTFSISRNVLLIAVIAIFGDVDSRTTLAQDAMCTLCTDGAEFDSSLSIGDVPCKMLENSAGFVNLASDDCLELQLLAYKNCRCPQYPPQYCALCDYKDGLFTNDNEKLVIDLRIDLIPKITSQIMGEESSSKVCGDILFVPSKVLDSCEDITQYAAGCGCTEAKNDFIPTVVDGTNEGEEATAIEGVTSPEKLNTVDGDDLMTKKDALVANSSDATYITKSVINCMIIFTVAFLFI